MLEHQESLRNPFGDLLAWANANVDKQLDVATIAEAAGLTPRTFARQFELHFHTTPARWVQELRAEAAKLHLLCPVAPIKAIPSVLVSVMSSLFGEPLCNKCPLPRGISESVIEKSRLQACRSQYGITNKCKVPSYTDRTCSEI
jgi:AraC-like DNA-binding protein